MGTGGVIALHLLPMESATAEEASASLRIGATVAPACSASTAGLATGQGGEIRSSDILVTCSSDGTWTISVSNEAHSRTNAESQPDGPITRITVTY